MIDIDNQVSYWRDGAEEDFEVATLLVERGNVREGLYFAYLALQKMFKAVVCKQSRDLPPRESSLLQLASKANLAVTEDQVSSLGYLNRFAVEGLYPEIDSLPPEKSKAIDNLERSTGLLSKLRDCL